MHLSLRTTEISVHPLLTTTKPIVGSNALEDAKTIGDILDLDKNDRNGASSNEIVSSEQDESEKLLTEVVNRENRNDDNKSEYDDEENDVKAIEVFGSKFHLNRIELNALFDRDVSLTESILKVILQTVVLTLSFTYLILTHPNVDDSSRGLLFGFTYSITSFVICFICASCQFSLLKSVQPDSGATKHGFDSLIVYSRSTYFIVLLIFLISRTSKFPYFFHSSNTDSLNSVLLSSFPILFMLGIIPRFDNLFKFASEQLEIHGFGGQACRDLSSTVFALTRSLVALLTLWGILHAAFYFEGDDFPNDEAKILIPLTLALTFGSSYLLSRVMVPTKDEIRWMFNEIFHKVVVAESDMNNVPTIQTRRWYMRKQIQKLIFLRWNQDMMFGVGVSILTFLKHFIIIYFSEVTFQLEYFMVGLLVVTSSIGFIKNQLINELRRLLPWSVIERPILNGKEYDKFQVTVDSISITWFEVVHLILDVCERHILLPLTFLSFISYDINKINSVDGSVSTWQTTLIFTLTSLKCMRVIYSDPSKQFAVIPLSYLFATSSTLFSSILGGEQSIPLVVSLFLSNIIVLKLHDLYLKLNFVFVYVAVWQISWGSIFHALSHFFCVPHASVLWVFQTVLACVFGMTQGGFFGSALFIASFPRTVRFWNTIREEDSTLDGLNEFNMKVKNMSSDNKYNEVFYEQLTHALRSCLATDIALGRWTRVNEGDFFFLMSDNMNCIVHIISLGNGFLTFQLRGLEFVGTYCQRRELEAVAEAGLSPAEPPSEPTATSSSNPSRFSTLTYSVRNRLKCFYSLRWSTFQKLPLILSPKRILGEKGLTWCVVQDRYVVPNTVSITSNSALLQIYIMRKSLITCTVRSLIYFLVQSWVQNHQWDELVDGLEMLREGSEGLDEEESRRRGVEAVFNASVDIDYDSSIGSVSPKSFCKTYLTWINLCFHHLTSAKHENDEIYSSPHNPPADLTENSPLTLLSYALSLFVRRQLSFTKSSMKKPSSALRSSNVNDQPQPTTSNSGVESIRAATVASEEDTTTTKCSNTFQSPYPLSVIHKLTKGDLESLTSCGNKVDDFWLREAQRKKNVLSGVLSKSMLMGIKLLQDCFISSCGGSDEDANDDIIKNQMELFNTIHGYGHSMLMIYEGDSRWRDALLQSTTLLPEKMIESTLNCYGAAVPRPFSMLSLRRIEYSNSNAALVGNSSSSSKPSVTYNVVMVNLNRCIGFRVVKLNRESVRGFWAAQQQELIFFRNDNPERGSIQNDKKMLRNIVNSSCNEPLGHPVYVSPIVPSFVESSDLWFQTFGEPLNVGKLKRILSKITSRMYEWITTITFDIIVYISNMTSRIIFSRGSASRSNNNADSIHAQSADDDHEFIALQVIRGPRRSYREVDTTICRSGSNVEEGVNNSRQHRRSCHWENRLVKIIDPLQVYDNINLGRRIDPVWPSPAWQKAGGRNVWKYWIPDGGMIGRVVHVWQPECEEVTKRSPVNHTILLIQIGKRYVPIKESAVQLVLTHPPHPSLVV